MFKSRKKEYVTKGSMHPYVCHIVPDGPELYLGVPGPLAVAIGICEGNLRHCILSSSTDSLNKINDPRLQNRNLIIFKKFQFRRRLASGLSPKLWVTLIKDKSNDMYHFHFSRSINSLVISYILMLKGRKFIIQTHGSVLPTKKFIIRFYDLVVTRKILTSALCVIVLQSQEISELKQIASNIKNTIIIRNAFQTKIRNRIISPKKLIYIGFVGHLRKGNEPIIFLNLAKLLMNDSRFRFVVVGPDGGERHYMEKLIQECQISNIRLLGNLDLNSLEAEYDKMDVLICPAKTAQALSFIDGLARGVLGITSKDNSSWEFFEKYGVKICENNENSYKKFLLSDEFEKLLYSKERVSKYMKMLEEISPESTRIRWNNLYSMMAVDGMLVNELHE